MQNIEQTIVELGSIFTQLATMVKEQEEMVQRFVTRHLVFNVINDTIFVWAIGHVQVMSLLEFRQIFTL